MYTKLWSIKYSASKYSNALKLTVTTPRIKF